MIVSITLPQWYSCSVPVPTMPDAPSILIELGHSKATTTFLGDVREHDICAEVSTSDSKLGAAACDSGQVSFKLGVAASVIGCVASLLVVASWSRKDALLNLKINLIALWLARVAGVLSLSGGASYIAEMNKQAGADSTIDSCDVQAAPALAIAAGILLIVGSFFHCPIGRSYY